MKSLAYCFTLLSIIAISLPALAQRARVFVSVTGNDANPCTAASPCRTFQAAHDAVLAGGEISVLDTGGYGTLVINKAISIVAVGVEAGIAIPSGGTGITISAGASDAVSLLGLTIDGAGAGQTGIAFSSGKSLTIKNSVIKNLTSSGIALGPSTSATIVVSDTLVIENGGHGIYLQPSGGGVVSGLFNHVEVYHNGLQGIGVFANAMCCSSFLKAMIVDSVSSFNGNAGIYALGGTVPLNLNVARSTTMGNAQSGLRAEASVYVTIAQSNLEDGWIGLPQQNQYPNVCSYGDNYTDGVPPPFCISPLSKY